jgi:T5orf172 domain
MRRYVLEWGKCKQPKQPKYAPEGPVMNDPFEQDALFAAGPCGEQSEWVYIIGPAESSVVKIGTAKNVKRRLGGIQTGHPEVLVIRWYTPGDRKLEDALHERFKSLRKTGEWFDFGDLEPVAQVRAAVEAIISAPAVEPHPEPEDLTPLVDAAHSSQNPLRPHPSDPDYGDPEYERMPCGCRFLTPTECTRQGMSGGLYAWRAGTPDEGVERWCRWLGH